MPLIIPIPYAPDPPAVRAVLAVWTFLAGAVCGSFLNVCIYRVPLGIPLNRPNRSFCPRCNAQLAWHENLPIVGWLLLRGRCAHCHLPISVRYPVVETLTACLFVAIWYVFGGRTAAMPHPATAAAWIMACFLIVAAFMDYDRADIPGVVTGLFFTSALICGLAAPALAAHRADASIWLGLRGVLAGAVGVGTSYALMAGSLHWYLQWKERKDGRAFVELAPEEFVCAPDPEHGLVLAFPDSTELPLPWKSFFSDGNQAFQLNCRRLWLAGRRYADVSLRCLENRLELEDRILRLDEVGTFSGCATVCKLAWRPPRVGTSHVLLATSVGAFLGAASIPVLCAVAVFIASAAILFADDPERDRRRGLAAAVIGFVTMAWVLFGKGALGV